MHHLVHFTKRSNKKLLVVFSLLFVLIASSILVTINTPAYAADPNLLAYWKYDEGVGATAADSSGNGYTGTLTTDAWSGNVPPVSFTNPYSAYFEEQGGIGNEVMTTSLQLNNLDQFTMSGWIYPLGTGNGMSIFGQNDIFEFGFIVEDAVQCWTPKGDVTVEINPQTFINQWHHITCLATETDLILYIDGINAGSTPIGSGSFGESEDTFAVGHHVFDAFTGEAFYGGIDDVRVYSRGLTPQEIEDLEDGEEEPLVRPSIVSTSPADNETDTEINTDLEIEFSIPVEPSTGSITLYDEDDTLVETFLATDDEVTIDGVNVTIDVTDPLTKSLGYYVQIDDDAFVSAEDEEANFPGINDETTWNFLTVSSGPAGVDSGLQLWLSASRGVIDGDDNNASDGETVETWQDRSNKNRDAARISGSAEFGLDGLNFNPTINFDEDLYEGSDTGLADGDQDRSIFVVASSQAGGWRYVLGSGTGPSDSNKGFDFGQQDGSNQVFITNHNNHNAVVSSWNPFGTARMAYGEVRDSKIYMSVNGSSPVIGNDGPTLSTVLDGALNIGSNSDGNEFWNGQISEVIYYNRVVSDTERQRINSYLALKYGFSLDQDTPQSYLASGSNLMWDKDATNASTYNNGLFGIGRDDDSGLSQVKSVGQSATNILTIEANNEGTNTSPEFDDLDNLEFLVIGDNNDDAEWTSSGAPAGFKILERKWAKQEQGNVGSVNLSFDVDDSDLDIPSAEGGVYYLIYDTDNDGSLSDETPTALTNISGNNWSTNLDFTNGTLFTLASGDTPKVEALTPEDNATDVSRVADLEIEFDRNVTIGTGEIMVYEYDTDMLVEQILVDGPTITIDENVVQIDRSGILNFDTQYYVLVDEGAFLSEDSQELLGITDKTEWSFTTLEDDGDPIAADVEDSGPNNGDANDDGILDSEQDNVVTFMSPVTELYVSIAVEGSVCAIESVDVVPANTLGEDSEYTYPHGMFDFVLDCLDFESLVTIELRYFSLDSEEGFSARKYINDEFITLDDSEIEIQNVGDDSAVTMIYTLLDGGELDADGEVNATIVDPAGLGRLIAPTDPTDPTDTPSTSADGTLPTTGSRSVSSMYAIALMLIVAGTLLTLSIRRRRAGYSL